MTGSLACSPFHVRFGKFALFRPSEKKKVREELIHDRAWSETDDEQVEFWVNDVKQEFAMKLGEEGETFFVFETSSDVPESLQTSPLVSPALLPKPSPNQGSASSSLQEPDFLDLDIQRRSSRSNSHSTGDIKPSWLMGDPRPQSLRGRSREHDSQAFD